eukprot:3451606-Rhodomonas_salina.2
MPRTENSVWQRTDIAYGSQGEKEGMVEAEEDVLEGVRARLGTNLPVWSYAVATPCPVLSCAVLLPGEECFGVLAVLREVVSATCGTAPAIGY